MPAWKGRPLFCNRAFKYISAFTGLCLTAKKVDELTKTALFMTGLSSEHVKREVQGRHRLTLQEAIRATRERC